ncbi:MAG: hypothetical protein JST54_28390 [Deltaproteobacteria bacterium]|nr:hypothetical protein [Deltaproteobacteria bacterium]
MEEGAVCIANIGPRERAKRMRFGLIALGLGVAVAVPLVATHVHWLWRLPVFLPLWMAGVGIFQAREHT